MIMNENNQPQSQQTKREPGYYWVKDHRGRQTIAEWVKADSGRDFWSQPRHTGVFDSDMQEIDERRIERASSESSHIPTEQPGDAKHTPGPYETGQVLGRTIQDELFYYDVYKHSGPIRRRVAQAYGVDQKEAEANAELIARAPALLSEVSTLRSKQAKLVAWNQKLREYITAEREISQRFTDENAKLRSERDKMREENGDYRNTLFNCLTQFEFYVDVTDFKDSGNAAIKHIQQLLLKYE